MKHFMEARLDCLNVLARDEISRSIDRVCLVFDLEGRIRVALRPVQGATEEECAAIRSALEEAADIFWWNEIWQEPTVSAAPSEKALFEALWAEARPEPPDQHRIYVLDRHYSKDAWLMDPFDLPWPLDGQSPPILSFYSFKGGVGRTTALLPLAVNAARAGLRCVIWTSTWRRRGLGPWRALGAARRLRTESSIFFWNTRWLRTWTLRSIITYAMIRR